MTKQFKDLTPEEQQTAVKNIGNCLKEHGFSSAVVAVLDEYVYMVGGEVQIQKTLSVEHNVSTDKADQVAKFSEAVKQYTQDISDAKINVNAQVLAGDKYLTIKNVVPLGKTEAVSLEHKEGEVWLLDFWATWCPPCQKPMAHNQEMLEKRAADWGQNVRIIGLSIDQSMEPLVKHVEDRKWTSVEHYHRAGSDASQVYNVKGVPHVMLIDKSGKIVFKGHPATRENLEADLDTLLKGEALTGEGIAVEKAAAGNEEPKYEPRPDFKEYDLEVVTKEIETFKDTCKAMSENDALKEAAKDMPRKFCVITLEQHYSPQNDSSLFRYMNHRVLVGKQDSIDLLSKHFEENVKGSFEINNQQRAL